MPLHLFEKSSRKVIKKLDKLIIRAFIGPFLATFLISLFVLVMQFFWLWIDDFVGKGLDLFTIFTLIGYVAATVVPLALPLALLLSSIMTFGNLGESFELVAIKSSGISLMRFMLPLLIVAIGVSGIAFLFGNNIIPVATLKLESLKYDVVRAKPALDIKEGVFYQKMEGYVIKLGKKEKDDSTIRNIIIYEKNYRLQDEMMVAESGIMRVTPDKRYLEFILKNGWRYQEKGTPGTTQTEFIQLGFKEYKKIFDLSSFQLARTADTLFQDHQRMLSIRQLDVRLDSILRVKDHYLKRNKQELNPMFRFASYADSVMPAETHPSVKATSFKSVIPVAFKSIVAERAFSQLNSANGLMDMLVGEEMNRERDIRSYKIEWHRKFTLAFACILLFMIGAPLGSIIRKGGLGTPLVFAVIFFIIFHLFNTFGEKFVKEDVTSAFIGMWLSAIVLLPVCAFLTYKAMHDSQLFNKEFYYRFFRRVRSLFGRLKPSGGAN
ncbi:MAG TPA: LptF/LptG family permease [Chitinophagaceae bacterium]